MNPSVPRKEAGRVGVIGGTGLYALLDDPETLPVETPFGARDVDLGDLDGAPVAFLARHGRRHAVPPHRLDPRADLLALKHCGVDAVLAVNNAGGLQDPVRAGDLVVPDDLIDLSGGEPFTLFDEEAVHVDLFAPYCGPLRATFLEAAGDWPTTVHDGGTYLQMRGPRFETRAEARRLATLGHVVGMTGALEAVIAREAGLCYAAACFVANATGARVGVQSADAVRDALAEHRNDLLTLLRAAVPRVPTDRDCPCRDAPAAGRMHDH